MGTSSLKGGIVVTWASLRAQESCLNQGGLQGDSIILGNYTTEQLETNRTRLLSEELSKELSKTISKANRNDTK